VLACFEYPYQGFGAEAHRFVTALLHHSEAVHTGLKGARFDINRCLQGSPRQTLPVNSASNPAPQTITEPPKERSNDRPNGALAPEPARTEKNPNLSVPEPIPLTELNFSQTSS